VAVLTTADFDATTLHVASLRFGPGGASTKHNGHEEDVDGDGDIDLMLHFPTQASGVSSDDTELVLTGFTVSGIPVSGSDGITTKGGKRKKELLAGELIPEEFGLAQNFPNPFNPSTKISYSIAEGGFASVTIFSILGREVAKLAQGYHDAGIYSVSFNASDLSNGTYFYVLEVNGQSFLKKMVYLK